MQHAELDPKLAERAREALFHNPPSPTAPHEGAHAAQAHEAGRDLAASPAPLTQGAAREEGAVPSPGNGRYYETAPTSSTRNKYTDRIDVARSDDKFEQQFTTLGLPCTDKSWAMQDRIDGGKLRVLNNLSFLDRVPPQLLKDVDTARFRELCDPKAHSPEERARRMDELNQLVRRLDDDPQVKDQFAKMSKRDFTQYQEGIVDQYVAMAARSGKDASFFLDVLPTEMEKKDFGDLRPENFMVGDYVLNTRESSAALAGHRQGQGRDTYGLAVPYANVAENILYRGGVPWDGVANLQRTIQAVEKQSGGATETIASGYSQGSTAVLKYAQTFGGRDGLDKAIALAPMGGNDLRGATGVHHGELGQGPFQSGVPTLAIENERDPARRINRNWGELSVISGALKFNNASQDESDIHAGMHYGTDPVTGQQRERPELGTKGYPTEHVMPLAHQLLDGQIGQGRYKKQSDWHKEIPNFQRKPEEGSGNPAVLYAD